MIRYPNDMVPSRSVRVSAGVVVVASVVASGYFMVMGLVDPGALVPGGGSDAARTFGGYVAARSIVLLGAMVWLLLARAWRPLGLVLALNAVVQLGDAVVGVAHGQVPQTVGPLVFAVALTIAARPLRGFSQRDFRTGGAG